MTDLRVVLESSTGYRTLDLGGQAAHFAYGATRELRRPRAEEPPLFSLSSEDGSLQLTISEAELILNGRPVRGRRTLCEGDRLQIDESTTLHFTLHPESIVDPVGPGPNSDTATLIDEEPVWLSSCESEADLRAGAARRSLEQEVAQASKVPSRRFGRYVLLSELGRGGFGCVFRAWDPHLERQVALKVLLRASGSARARFEREVRVTARLNHPNIVAVHDSGAERDHLFLVMDYVDGRTLEDLTQGELRHMDPPKRMRRAARILRDVARAMDHAHEHTILHRDIKPANIIVDAQDHPYVVDFGLARLKAEDRLSLTQTGTAVGTPLYMAPEQAEGRATNKRVDIYALGATLFYALTARPPIQADSVTEFYEKLLEGAEPPSACDPDVPPRLDEICIRCLAVDPEARYGSSRELAADLTEFLDAGPLAAAVRQRTQPLVVLLVAMCVVLVGLLVVVVLRERRRSEARAAAERRAVHAPPRPMTLRPAPEPRPEPEPPEPAKKPAVDAARWVERGDAHMRGGAFREAITCFGEALRLDPRGASTLLRRGQAWLKLGEHRKAGADFSRAVELEPHSELGWALLNTVTRALQTANLEKRAIDKALAVDPKNHWALFHRVILWGRAGEFQRALRGAERLVRIRPGFARAYYARGVIRVKLNDRAGAIADLERFVKMDPQSPQAPRARKRLQALRKR